MITIQLTQAEQELLTQILECCISDIRMEIADTDNINFKQMLKNRKAIMKQLLSMVQSATQNAGSFVPEH